jgi:hypothetical protein
VTHSPSSFAKLFFSVSWCSGHWIEGQQACPCRECSCCRSQHRLRCRASCRSDSDAVPILARTSASCRSYSVPAVAPISCQLCASDFVRYPSRSKSCRRLSQPLPQIYRRHFHTALLSSFAACEKSSFASLQSPFTLSSPAASLSLDVSFLAAFHNFTLSSTATFLSCYFTRRYCRRQ